MAEPNLYPNYPSMFVRGHHVARAADNLPQTTTESLFTIAGGRVLITALIGEVTTVIQNSDPVAKLTSNPTTGSSVDIASTADLTSLEAGGFVVCEGDGTALVLSNAGAAYMAAGVGFWVCPIGTIDLTTGASKTGAFKWDLFYIPIDEGASVVAA
jgi:hypothetical protein